MNNYPPGVSGFEFQVNPPERLPTGETGLRASPGKNKQEDRKMVNDTITVRHNGKTYKVDNTTGVVITDYQMLRWMRNIGIIPAASRDEWVIGVGFDHVGELVVNRRTPSGRISAKIDSMGAIKVDGYLYQGHSFGGQLSYCWIADAIK